MTVRNSANFANPVPIRWSLAGRRRKTSPGYVFRIACSRVNFKKLILPRRLWLCLDCDQSVFVITFADILVHPSIDAVNNAFGEDGRSTCRALSRIFTHCEHAGTLPTNRRFA
eukprot:6188052-Pleurochrysis_carterae.AAC.5